MPTLSDYRDRAHWSYSSLNQLLNICSQQYFYERIEKLPRAFTPASLVYGTVYHRVMEWIALHRMEGTVPAQNDVRDLFHTLWERELESYEDTPMEQTKECPEALARQGAGLAQAYCGQINPDERVIALNRTFAVPVGKSERPLIGEIDCVTELDGTISLVDWKTSARRWPKDQADRSLQPTVYLYAINRLEPGYVQNFHFDVAVKNKSPVIERNTTVRTEGDFARLERFVEKAEQLVEHGLFHPSDQSFACNACQYRDACRNWHTQTITNRRTA